MDAGRLCDAIHLHSVRLSGDDQLLVQLVPNQLLGLALHFEGAQLHQTQHIHDGHARVGPLAKLARRQLSSVAETYRLASLNVELAHLLELGEENAVETHLVLKGQQHRISLRIDRACQHRPLPSLREVAAEHRLAVLDAAKRGIGSASEQAVLFASGDGDRALALVGAAVEDAIKNEF